MSASLNSSNLDLWMQYIETLEKIDKENLKTKFDIKSETKRVFE